MLSAIILNDRGKWTAPAWVARHLAACLDNAFILPETDAKERFSELVAGRASVVDLSGASSAEMRELLEAAELARRVVKRPSEWAEPASALEFITAFDRFLHLLRSDERVEEA
jgi:hypothetical protein